MACCCPQACATGSFFSRFARSYRRRYRRRGLERTQQQLIAGLQEASGWNGAALLEIGSGVGYLHQYLLMHGAASAVGVDLSEQMLVEAQQAAAEQGLADRVRYRAGDFVALADDLPSADVTLLDKVVCCYPDAESLIRASLAKTRRVYALTYPRDRGFVRFGVGLMTLVLRLVGSGFRTYVHDPRSIENWITASGLRKRYQSRTAVWCTEVYARD